MSRPTPADAEPAPRFHIQERNGLYRPIVFMFVTRRMCMDILAERQRLLASLPKSRYDAQCARFARYDPRTSARMFLGMLSLFNGLRPDAGRSQDDSDDGDLNRFGTA
ncbi:MAG: hypothetical protein ACK4KV_10885 [Rhodocyclaceae bacterium]